MDERQRDQLVSLRGQEALAGEIRVNFIRLAAVLAFFLNHLFAHYIEFVRYTNQASFHAAVLCIVAFWFLDSLFVYFWTSLKPWTVKGSVIVHSIDLLMIATLIGISSDGPQSQFVFLLPLLIVASALRLQLALIYVATLGSLLVYWVTLGYYVFVQVGAEAYYAQDSLFRIPRYEQFFASIMILVTGLVAGQYTRQALRLAYTVASASSVEDTANDD